MEGSAPGLPTPSMFYKVQLMHIFTNTFLHESSLLAFSLQSNVILTPGGRCLLLRNQTNSLLEGLFVGFWHFFSAAFSYFCLVFNIGAKPGTIMTSDIFAEMYFFCICFKLPPFSQNCLPGRYGWILCVNLLWTNGGPKLIQFGLA